MTMIGIGPQSQIGLLVERPPVRVQPDCRLGEVARVMRDANVSSVIVGRGEAIITERDLTNALATGLGPETFASIVAVNDPVTVDIATRVVDGASEMIRREIRHLVVTHRGEVIGVVSLRDAMVVLLQAVEPEVWLATLRAAVVGRSEMWLG
jgi:signal-transduction protein with cAMP-binding, CBS, and nucleotidyltransferase domain